jgi:hypothetical protein
MLLAGAYDVYGTIRLDADGVVLRGAGDDEDTLTNTVIRGKGNTPDQRTILVAGGGSSTFWRNEISGSRSNIISDTVAVGSRSFRVANPSLYAEGDNIIIFHDGTAAWLQAVDFGGTATDPPWAVGEQPIVYNRYITAISGDTISIDAPVFNHLVRSLSQCYIYTYARTGLVTNVGIEHLRIDIETAGGTDESHAWNAIDLYQIEDAWVTQCTMLHFGLSGIRSNTASRITVDSCRALDPVSIIEGGKRYNFNIYTGSQLILFSHCLARNGRHHYVSNGVSRTSGCVFLDCVSEGAYASSEGHRWWSTGLLYDNLTEVAPNTNGALLGLYNRGDYGTSHGWAAAHSVAWRCNLAGRELIVQKPPTAQNYAIGCSGQITGDGPYSQPAGYIEGANSPGLVPRSLYLAQLAERMNPPVTLSVPVEEKWNMVSVPLQVDDRAIAFLFPAAVSQAFVFASGTYTAVDSASTNAGMWLKFGTGDTVEFNGYARHADTIALAEGWNLVGTLSSPVSVVETATLPPAARISDFFGYSGGYLRADTLYPGRGYWMKSAETGSLILRSMLIR